MHSFIRHRHRSAATADASTTGLVLNRGWRYDLTTWCCDTLVFRGQLHALRLRTTTLAHIQPGQQVLDVGCGTGTLALEVSRRVGSTGYVAGIDPGAQQIARARAKAARRKVPIDFQIATIEHLPFADQTFDVVVSTLMMHHVSTSTKRQGLAEIARVLKPSGCLVIADFLAQAERHGLAARFHAGGSHLGTLAALVADAGFERLETEELRGRRFSGFPGAGFVSAHKGADHRASPELQRITQ